MSNINPLKNSANSDVVHGFCKSIRIKLIKFGDMHPLPQSIDEESNVGQDVLLDPITSTARSKSSTVLSIERDIYELQELSLLIGVQGSGMINALYLPKGAASLAIYLNTGWPLTSGDPLSLLKGRGPYVRYINRNDYLIVCESNFEAQVMKYIILVILS
jgi:hypothetical protein